MFSKTLLVLAMAASGAIAQRPNTTSICDYYTTALLTNNTAANQMTLLTLLVNTAVIGNYTTPNANVTVPGILAAGEYNGTAVNLAPYFNGGLASTNTGGMMGQSVNFLDGGGATPLMDNKPANDNTSLQYMLLTHLYSYFGVLLGCSSQTNATADSAFPKYSGSNNMYEVHKFMGLSSAELGYFISQVALSAKSFGVQEDDIAAVGMALNSLFGYRCSPETVVVSTQPAALQAMCTADDCPLAPVNATCDAYAAVVEPSIAVSSLVPSSASATGTATGTATASSAAGSAATGAATAITSVAFAAPTNVPGNLAAAALGLAVMLL